MVLLFDAELFKEEDRFVMGDNDNRRFVREFGGCNDDWTISNCLLPREGFRLTEGVLAECVVAGEDVCVFLEGVLGVPLELLPFFFEL